jgi:hypothetical protein
VTVGRLERDKPAAPVEDQQPVADELRQIQRHTGHDAAESPYPAHDSQDLLATESCLLRDYFLAVALIEQPAHVGLARVTLRTIPGVVVLLAIGCDSWMAHVSNPHAVAAAAVESAASATASGPRPGAW